MLGFFPISATETVDFIRMDGYPVESGYYLIRKKDGYFVSFYGDVFTKEGMRNCLNFSKIFC